MRIAQCSASALLPLNRIRKSLPVLSQRYRRKAARPRAGIVRSALSQEEGRKMVHAIGSIRVVAIIICGELSIAPKECHAPEVERK
jgi:hypothetical protein